LIEDAFPEVPLSSLAHPWRVVVSSRWKDREAIFMLEAKAAREIRKINYGHTLRHHDLAKLDLTSEGGTPTVSIFRTEPLPRPIHIRVMERHLHGSRTGGLHGVLCPARQLARRLRPVHGAGR
jgi:hypothetical protein